MGSLRAAPTVCREFKIRLNRVLNSRETVGAARKLLMGESNQSIESVPRPTLEGNFQEETDIYDIHNLEDLTDKIEVAIVTIR